MTDPTLSGARSAPSAVTALAKALSAEHAAVYAYGVIGGKTSGTLRTRANAGFAAHRARRDRLWTLIVERGGTPSEPGGIYPLPFPVKTAADAVRLAVQVEERLTTAYLELAAAPDPAVRELAARTAQECAVRGYGWQPVVVPLPGMPGQTALPPGGTPAADPSATPSDMPSDVPSDAGEPSEPDGH